MFLAFKLKLLIQKLYLLRRIEKKTNENKLKNAGDFEKTPVLKEKPLSELKQ